ncbi:uncharacterized protein BP5553_06145 [Venustampulla echinocandica]|uniref:Ribosome maturation protein SDO1/SBDS N-terminal domain-containing protein n=1 Tax=Venustampulla echinocandica TaxID=2656787 RepID=A0A370TMN1_9HELO|nr:uncharacterized protein BP5553_06145 [Venustampulla echinocandica]RDL36793.1 hypothetical protein BP5553_06145 [Venustampulla echinocandica]
MGMLLCATPPSVRLPPIDDVVLALRGGTMLAGDTSDHVPFLPTATSTSNYKTTTLPPPDNLQSIYTLSTNNNTTIHLTTYTKLFSPPLTSNYSSTKTTATMARGEAVKTRCQYQGEHDNFVVFVDRPDLANDWKTDKSIPLTHIVSTFKVFITHKSGAQGGYDGASNATLENEFGTHNEDEVIKQILEKGNMQEFEFPERQGGTNDSNGLPTRF